VSVTRQPCGCPAAMAARGGHVVVAGGSPNCPEVWATGPLACHPACRPIHPHTPRSLHRPCFVPSCRPTVPMPAAYRWPTVLVQAAHLENMRAEDLKPGQQPLQRRKFGKLAVQYGLNRLHGSGEVLRVKQLAIRLTKR